MFPLVAAALVASVSGVVLDPQDLTVRDARVEVTCGDRVDVVITDQEGRFTVGATADDCVVEITREGFAPSRHRLSRSPDLLVIHLQVAPVKQLVDVVAADPAPARVPFGSIALSADEQNLRTFAGTTADLIRYAQLVAGTATRPASVSVDGLPSGSLPPIDAIAHVSINGDPFSAEYADSDVTSIDIITKAPARAFRVFAGGDMPGIDGRDMLAPALRTTSRFINLGMMGPVPRLPLTFSATGHVSRASQEMPIHPGLASVADVAGSATAASRNGSASVSLHYAPTASLRGRVSFRESRARSTNVGVGGVTLQEAGFASSYMAREHRATATKVSSKFLYEGGVVIASTDSRTRANATSPGITVGGDVVMGGSPVAESRRQATRWTARQVVRSQSVRPWTIGIAMSGTHDANRHTPNSGGAFYFADAAAYTDGLAGGHTATWHVTRGEHPVHVRSQTTAAFAQTEFLRAGEFVLAAGVRADYQSGFGVLASPRVSLATRWRGLGLRAGAGMFVQRVPDIIFISVMENDGHRLQHFLATDASLVEPAESLLRAVRSIQPRAGGGLTRPRGLQWRLSAERPVGSLTLALEYSVSDNRRLVGSNRVQTQSGWMDAFESNRRALRQRLHQYARYAWKRQQFVVDYEFARAHDNTDGPFSFPEQSGNLADEWARSAGVPPHSVTFMSAFALPAAISLTVIDNWRSRSPYNITTAHVSGGNGLFLDRGGRARNSGDGLRFHAVSLYAHRRVDWADVFKAPPGSGIDISLQADNIFNNRNYLGVGSIAGSTTFGQPLAAYPGRSVRVLFSVN